MAQPPPPRLGSVTVVRGHSRGWNIFGGVVVSILIVVFGIPLLLIGTCAYIGWDDCRTAPDGKDVARLPEASLSPPRSTLDGPPVVSDASCGALDFEGRRAYLEQKYVTSASIPELDEFYRSRLLPRWKLESRGPYGSSWTRDDDRVHVAYDDGKLTFRISRRKPAREQQTD